MAASVAVEPPSGSGSKRGPFIASEAASSEANVHKVAAAAHLKNCNLLELRSSIYFSVWSLIIAIHCLCGAYLAQLARVYWFVADPSMDYWGKLAAGDRHDYLRHAGVLFGLLSVPHWWQLFCILRESLRAREFVLPAGSSTSIRTTIRNKIDRRLSLQGLNRLSSVLMSSNIKTLALPSRFIYRTWRFLFSRKGVFGVESDLFSVVFIVREMVEIISQSFQAHRSSELLPRPWINHLFAVVVVVNCWSTPFLQHFLHRHQGTERVVCLLLDVLLNMGSSMLIPIAVFLPYYQAFIPAIHGFSFEELYDALWFSRFVMESRLLFSLSTVDIFSKLVPHVGIYTSLVGAATLIRRKRATRKTRVLPNADSSTLVAMFKAKSQPRGASSDLVAGAAAAIGPATEALAASSAAPQRNQQVVHLVFFLWGLTLLVLHVRAVTWSREVVMGCRQVTGSWFATNFPCSVYAYNCYREGTATPSEDSWDHLNEASLVYLTISHCPELKMPRRVQDFPNLLGFQLHNTTLVEWGKSSAISATKHTKMVVLVIAKTNLTGIPDGMLEPLPAELLNIQMTHTNLTTLPPDLHEKWHPMSAIFIEHSRIATFPKTLLSIYTRELSLHGNLIETVPELTDKHQRFFACTLSANPLRELPETLGNGTSFAFFSAERTLLTALPAWATTSVDSAMFLHGTPYCDARLQDGLADTKIACVQRDNRVDGKVPIAIFDPRIPL